MKEKININERYFEKEEVRTNSKPYDAYYDCLNSTFDLNNTNSFCDIGCATGLLMKKINENNKSINLLGVDYFQWHKDSSRDLIKDSIIIHDLRDALPISEKYDIVNCTETGEHIDKAFQDDFIENLKSICGKYLIISWSDTGGENDRKNDTHIQHLNPMSSGSVNELLIKHGFKKNNELTEKFIKESNKNSNFNFWWRKSLGVWEIN